MGTAVDNQWNMLLQQYRLINRAQSLPGRRKLMWWSCAYSCFLHNLQAEIFPGSNKGYVAVIITGDRIYHHIYIGEKTVCFFFHILCSYEGRSLRSLVNKKTSRRTVLWLCSTMTFLSVPCKYASSIGLLPEVSSVVWFLVSFPSFLEF